MEGTSPRFDASLPGSFINYEPTQKQPFYQYVPEEAFLGSEKLRYPDVNIDDYIGTGSGGSGESDSLSPTRIEGFI